MIGLAIADRIAVARGEQGYELELESTGILLACAETQGRVRAFLEKRG